MNAQTLSDKAPGRHDATLVGAVATGVFALVLALGHRILADPDILWHVETARWIVAHRALPVADPFSHTMAGTAWIAKEWLAQIAYWGGHAIAGWFGVVALAAVAVALAFALLFRALLDELRALPALALTAAAFMLAAPHILARPHVLAYPLIVLWTAGLYRAVAQGRSPSWWLLPVLTLWANVHGGFTLGLALVLPAAIEAVLRAEPEARRQAGRRWALFGLLAFLGAAVTPYGAQSMLVTQRILGLGEALPLIGEWRPQDFSRPSVFEVILIGGLAASWASGLRLPWTRIVALAGLVHLALAHVRNDELLGLIAPILIAGPLARQWPGLGRRAEPSRAPDGRVWLRAVAPALAASVALAAWSAREAQPNPVYSPAAALSAARAVPVAGTVLNDLGFGGFLIAQGVPTFIDGRLELFGEDLLLRHHRATSLLDWSAFSTLARRYAVGWTLLTPGTPLIGYLDTSPDWRRAYADAWAVVHVRAGTEQRP